tara:strand:+ start:101 stop:1084 length:984 start_codon:yes stop_codon:yes gene_type:complete
MTTITSGLSGENINFILDSAALNPSLTVALGISGEDITGDERSNVRLIRCDVSASDFHSVFRMQSVSDIGDGTDVSANDLRFKHHVGLNATKFRTKSGTDCSSVAGDFLTKLAKQDSASNYTTGSADETKYFHHGATDYSAHDDAKKLEADILRTISKHVFHTVHGIDLFANENTLLENIQALDVAANNALFAAAKTHLGAVDYYNYANISSDGADASGCIGATLFSLIATDAPERFDPSASRTDGYKDILDGAGTTTTNQLITDISGDDGIPIPVKVGDKLYVKITINMGSMTNPISSLSFSEDADNEHNFDKNNRNVYYLEITLV